MQGTIVLLSIIMQVSGPMTLETQNSSPYELIGRMDEIVVSEPQYENEDDAWSGMMPEVVVAAPRYTEEEIAAMEMMDEVVVVEQRYASADRPVLTTRYDQYHNVRGHALDINILQGLVQAQPAYDARILTPTAMTFSGDYHLAEGDTIDEDVTVSGGNAKIDGVIDGDLAVMGGMVDVNGMIDGDIAVFGGNLDIQGTVKGDAAVFGGNTTNKGTIAGDLLVIGGTVLLDSGSVVEGNINMVGGTVDRDENAVVLGDIESVEIEALQKVLPRISRAFRFPRMLPGARFFPRLIFIGLLVVLYVFNLLILLMFPQGIDRVAAKIQHSVWASVGLGLAMEILFTPLIVLFAVSIIGIPLIILLPLAVFLGTLFGFSALSFVLGERVAQGMNWKISSRVGIFSLGWIAIMIIPIVTGLIGPPVLIIGFVIVYVALTIGLGSVIYAIIKRRDKSSKK